MSARAGKKIPRPFSSHCVRCSCEVDRDVLSDFYFAYIKSRQRKICRYARFIQKHRKVMAMQISPTNCELFKRKPKIGTKRNEQKCCKNAAFPQKTKGCLWVVYMLGHKYAYYANVSLCYRNCGRMDKKTRKGVFLSASIAPLCQH